jgi:hypothetical protein
VISRLLKEKGREQFWQKKGNLLRTRKKKFFFKWQGAPWEVKGYKATPWWQKGAEPF